MFHNYDRAIRGKRAAAPIKKQSKKKKKYDQHSDNEQSVDSGEVDNSSICYENNITSGASVASTGIIPPTIENNRDCNSTITDISSSVVRDRNDDADLITNARQSFVSSIVTPNITAPKEIAT